MFAEPAWHIASQVWLNKNPLRNTAVVSNHCAAQQQGEAVLLPGAPLQTASQSVGESPFLALRPLGLAKHMAPVVPAMLLIKLAGGKDGKKYERVVPVWEPANSSSTKITQKLYNCFLLMTAWRGCWCDSEEQVGCALRAVTK